MASAPEQLRDTYGNRERDWFVPTEQPTDARDWSRGGVPDGPDWPDGADEPDVPRSYDDAIDRAFDVGSHSAHSDRDEPFEDFDERDARLAESVQAMRDAREAGDHAAYAAAWTRYDAAHTRQPAILADPAEPDTVAFAVAAFAVPVDEELQAEMAAAYAHEERFRATASSEAIAARDQQLQRAQRDMFAAVDNEDPAALEAAEQRFDEAWWLEPDGDGAAAPVASEQLRVAARDSAPGEAPAQQPPEGSGRPTGWSDHLDGIAAVARDRTELHPLIRASLSFHTAYRTARAVHAADPNSRQWWRDFANDMWTAAVVADDVIGGPVINPDRITPHSLPDSLELRQALTGLVEAGGAALAEHRLTDYGDPALGITIVGLRLARPDPQQHDDLNPDGLAPGVREPRTPVRDPGPGQP
jgi:hypothetical protein